MITDILKGKYFLTALITVIYGISIGAIKIFIPNNGKGTLSC